MWRMVLLGMLCIKVIVSYATVQEQYVFTSSSAQQRFYKLLNETRCIVCQNQSLAESNAPLANDLREKIYTLIQTNQDDNNIKTYLVKRYGDFILLEPPQNPSTFFLWFFPILGLSFFVFICIFLSRRQHG